MKHHIRFYFSERQFKIREEQYVEYLRYEKLSFREKAETYFPPFKPSVLFVKTELCGEIFWMEFTEQSDVNQYPDYFSSSGDLFYEYDSDKPAEIILREYNPDTYPYLEKELNSR